MFVTIESIARAKRQQRLDRLRAGLDPTTGKPMRYSLACAWCDVILFWAPASQEVKQHGICENCASLLMRQAR
jgi:hypothetical protein